MSDSILLSTKKALGIDATYDVFDPDLVMFINAALSTLEQLGIGPVGGFSIVDDAATWSAFLGGDPRYNDVKAYVYLRARLLFDPPSTSFLITAFNEQRQELEWRMNVRREQDNYTPQGILLDGGTAVTS